MKTAHTKTQKVPPRPSALAFLQHYRKLIALTAFLAVAAFLMGGVSASTQLQGQAHERLSNTYKTVRNYLFGSPVAITQFVAGMSASGTAPFDSLDAGVGDSDIRTHDFAVYRVGYSLTPADTGVLIKLETGAFTLPGGYTGPALTQVARFDVADLPTGASGCQNISSSAVADPPPAGTSGVTANGQKLYCYQPSPVSGNNQDFRLRINGDAPNGTIVQRPIVTLSGNGNPATSSPTTLNGVVGAETFYGLPALTVKATPRWNVEKGTAHQGPQFVPGSGPNGEDGFVFGWSVGVYATGSRKGLEALSSVTLSDNFNDPDFPNARLVTWPIIVPGFSNINLTPNNCGNWNSQAFASANNYDSPFARVGDLGTSIGTQNYQVRRGGTCQVTAFDNTAKTFTATLTGTDFSLLTFPTKKGTNAAAANLINLANLDDSTNEWWVANKLILIWAPVTDIPVPPNPNTLFLTNTINLSGNSVTGQANVEPVTADNSLPLGATRTTGGTFSKVSEPMGLTYNNPFNLDYPPRDPNVTSAQHVNQLAPSQVYMARLRTVMGTESLGAGMVCDKLDNTRATFFDATDSAYVAAPVGTGEQVRDPLTGIVTRYLAGSSTTIPITWELGVGGTGTSGGTWTSFNTVGNEYNAPATTGASQATSGCSNGDATWYPSVAALLAAGHTLQEVTRVRGRYAMMPGGADLLYRIPLQMRATYAYSGTDNAPGGPFTAGQSAVGAMHSNQAFWDDGLGTLRTAADAIHIFQNEYAQISKTSTNFPIANSLVPVGTQVNYRLTVNLTTGGSEHTTDVTVWDVLPNQMSYVPGSSTFGGAPLADPVCANSGLPTALFPGGTTPAGFTACQWTLTNQTAKKVDLGATAGNLPVLNFNAAVSLTAPNGTQLLNTSFADTTGNNLSDAVYGGAGTGFRCNTGDVCSFSNWILNVSATPGILLSKTVDKTLVPTNTGFTYSLFYSAIGLPLSNVRLLDVLPYSGDGRSPATNYAGTLQLTGPIAAPAAAAGPPATAADANIIILYTSNAPANINRDPYHAGHNLAGGGTNSATTTNFCTAAQFGSANCPAGFAQVTGFMALPLAAAAPPDLPVGSLFRLNVPVQPTGNARLNVYTNDYVGDSPSLSARRPGSNIVSTTVSQPDLLIAKSASPGSVPQGQTGTFTLSVSNNTGTGVGPIDALPAPTITVTDTLPTGLTIANAAAVSGTNWNCSGSAAPSTINCVYTGPLPIGVGGAVGGPITINYTVGATATPGSVTNTGNVAMTGQTEFPTNNNSGTASVTILPTSDLSITKTNNVTTAAAGTSVTYTIVARNNGPQGVTGATVTDTFPAAISSATWTCGGGTGGGTCGAASGTGNINATVNLPNGATVTFTVTAQISQSATGTLSNTATIAVPSGTTELNATNNTATDGPDTLTQQSDLAVTKTDNATVRLQGTQTTYVIVVTNNGPSAVTGATVTDTLPAQLTGATWTCVGNGAGASCGTANGTGNVSTTVNLNSGTSATITLTATIAANFTGSLSNTATVAAPAGVTDSVTTNNTATDTTTVNPAADIQVTKTLAPSSQVNGKIVLSTTTPSGTRDIYTINPDGSGLTLIHAGAGRDENPVWSPDGSKIAFASNSFDGTTRVGVMNANGSGVTQLTFVGSNPGNEIDSPYGWSPDGSKIIFRSFRDGNFEIYVMNADGSNQTRLINNAAVDTGGTFSPDGSKIVFTSNRDGDNEIFVMNADGSGIVQLTNNTFSDTVDFSAWSPDGTKILFASNRDGNSEIYVMNSDGTGQTRLTTDAGADIQPAWSPDGTKILFTSNRDGDNDFYTMNANGSGVTSLLSNTENGEADATWLPVVAAGSTLAYTVKVTNAGPSSTDVTMTDNIPANTVFASLSSPAGWNCTTPAVGGTGTVSCSKSGVALGEMASFVVNVVVSPAALNGAVVSNTATATSSVTDPNTANNSSTVPRGISALPDLAVSIGAPLGPLTVGQTSQLPFSVTNIGGAPATGPIVVTATLPANATAPANFTSGPFTCTTAGQTVTCTAVGPLNPMAVIGGQVPLTITAATPNPAPIVVAVAPATGETNTGNNMGTGSFPVNPAGGGNVAPDLAVSIGSPVAPFQPGVQSNVSVTVQNIGTGPTTGPITVTVPVPASVTVPTNFTSGGFTCTTAAGVVTCTAPGPINPWQTNTIQVPMTPAVGTANVPVSATVATTGDSNPTNNTAGPVNFPVGGNYPDLTPSIGTLANVQFGVQSTIPITVSNVGPGATTAAITTTITLPPNTTVPASFTSGGFSCTTSGTTVTCTNAGPINAGANTVIQLPVTPGNTGPLVITATTNTTGDPNPTNNTATTTIQTLLPDVTVAIGSPQGPLTVGQTSLLPVTMTNIGGAPAQGPLTFTATIPSNTTAPASFTSGNFTCTTAGQTVTCTTPGPLAPGQSGIAQIPLTVTGPTPNPAPITVTVATVPGETNTSNNTAGPSSFPVNTGGGNPTLAPDLAVALGSPAAPFQAGVQSNVPVTVSNVGTGATTGPITVTIPVPAGVTVPAGFTNGGFTCTTASGTVTCTAPGPLANGGSTTFNVPMTPAVGTTSVTITPTVTTAGDPNSSNNTVTGTFPVGGNFVDVATAISQPSGLLINGATVNLPVTVSNLGNVATGAVTTTIALPPNTTAPANFSSGGFTCTTSGLTVTCTNPGPLAANAGSTIQVPVTVTSTTPLVATFTATSNTAGDANPSNNTATRSVPIQIPDLVVSIGSPQGPLTVGQTSQLPFTVSNIGGAPAAGPLVVTATLPANATAPAGFTSGPFTCTTAGQTVTCTAAGPLNAGASIGGQIPLTVTAATPNPAPITISVPPATGEINTANNTGTVSFPVNGPQTPDLAISLGSPSGPFQPGVLSNLPVTVQNVGSGSTTGPITVTIPVPNGVTIPASFNSGGYACTTAGSTVTCTAPGPLNPGQSNTIQVPMTPPTGATSVTVSAMVATTGDPNPTNNTAGPITYPIGNYPDLTPSIGTLASVQFGVQSTIPITVSNVGPGATTAAITTTITLPPNTTVPASFTSGGFSCTTSGTTVTCTNAGPINAGANTVIQLPVTPGNTGPLVITATTNTTGDPNPTNNTATASISNLLPDVTVSIGSPQGPLTVGQTSLLPVTMTNIGGAPAQGPLTFTATIPSNTTAPASFTSGNFTCTTSGQTVTCTTPGPLNPGQSGIAQIPLTVTGPTPNPAPITVTVATVPGETNTSNNTAGPSSFPVNTGGGNPTLAPDLAVALGSPVGPFQAGVQSNVPVTVSNVGTGATTGPITVTIPVPAGVTVPGNFTSGGFSCTTAGGTVTCTSAQILPNGSAATIQVPMTPAVGTNSVTITPTVTTVGDPNASNNTATATFPVGGNFVDVATAIGQPSGALINGATVNLPVTVSNLGNTATGAVTTTIILPPNTTAPANFTSGGFTCTTAGSTVTCSNPGPLAAGASSTIQVPVTVTGTMPPVVTFVATSNTAGDVNPSNNTATAIFNLRLPDVAVSLGAPINPLIVGQTSAVPFTVSNIGGSNTVGATLTATIALPANMIAPANFTTGPFTCATAGQTITCTTNGPITPGTALTGQLPLTVIAATPNPATLTVSVPANGGETNTANNTASGSFPVGTNPGPMPPDMTVSIASPVAAFQPGVQSNVPVTVSNVGSGSTVGPITVTIPVPNGVTVPASFNSGGFACTVTGGLVTCTAGGPINPNQSATIQVPMTPAAGLNSVTVVATVGTPGDTNAGNNTAQATFLVGGAPAPDLMLGIGTIPALVVGQTSVIPVNVSNVGNGATTGPITVTITLPAGTGTPGNFTSGGFTCQGGGATVVCTAPGPINANATATIQVPVIPNAAGTLVITATGNTAGDTNAGNNTATAQAPVTDGAVGPGNPISPFGTTLSDQKPGSVLIFPVYTSSSDPTRQNTRINLTNVNTNRLAMVHLFFVSESCQVADAYVCLTANQTTSFLASDLDPGTTGYLVAVATDANGCPTNFNFLIGDEYVKFQSGHAANLGAEAIPALATALPACDQNAVTATLAFNGVNYARVPAALALDSIASRADGNDTMLIVNRIGGNLGIGAATLGSIFGILYDDAEVSVSFSFSGSCQFRSSISNNFPRTTPRFETFIPAGRTGWLKIYAQGGVTGLTGAAINFNANASASAGAFNQGHNLHALTLNDQMTYVIPVFPPNC